MSNVHKEYLFTEDQIRNVSSHYCELSHVSRLEAISLSAVDREQLMDLTKL